MKFLADETLGKLAKWLRILGYDTLYFRRIKDDELLELAVREERLVLTRDTHLLRRRKAKNCLLIRYDHLEDQLRQLISEINLQPARLFSRCLECNLPLEEMPQEAARLLVPPFVWRTQQHFRRCPRCRRIFWPATHIQHMLSKLNHLGLVGEE